MKTIIGRKNKIEIQIDEEDYIRLSNDKWSFSLTEHGYIFCNKYIGKIEGKYKYERKYLHALIVGTPKGLFTDHVNGDRLDNRKENLRICTAYQNSLNKKGYNNVTSKYKGVYKHTQYNRWVSQIKYKGTVYSLGCFKTPEEAALTYNEKAKELHGEYARLNIIK